MRSQAVYLVGSYLATYVAKRSSFFILFSSVGLALSIAQVPFRLFKSLAHRIACQFFVGLAYRGLIFPITLRNFQELS